MQTYVFSICLEDLDEKGFFITQILPVFSRIDVEE
jgi:hypothetical protein